MALSINLTAILGWTHTSALDQSTITDSSQINLSDTLASGTAVDQADQIWHDRRTLTATSENLDLAGSLVNAFGATLTFARIKGILIKNRSTTAGANLIVGGAAANQFPLFSDVTDKIPIGPDGFFFYYDPSAAGKVVTAGTGDQLKIDAGASTIDYDIVLIGASA